MPPLARDGRDDGIRDLPPTQREMRACLARPFSDRQRGVEQQHALFRPAGQIAAGGRRGAEILRPLLVDVDERARQRRRADIGEGEPVGMAGRRIGILPEDDGTDRVERRQRQCGEDPLRRGSDDMAGRPLGIDRRTGARRFAAGGEDRQLAPASGPRRSEEDGESILAGHEERVSEGSNRRNRHCEKRSDQAIQGAGLNVSPALLDCFAAPAMTDARGKEPIAEPPGPRPWRRRCRAGAHRPSPRSPSACRRSGRSASGRGRARCSRRRPPA
ncbi:hypothetical protein BTHI11S_06296 [Bosea thiooxidans]